MDTQIGEAAGFTILLVLILLVAHWIVRKIRRAPKKRFRDWVTSWSAGAELIGPTPEQPLGRQPRLG